MKRYLCETRCQWQRQLWCEGDTVEVEGGSDGLPPSPYFRLIEDDVPVEPDAANVTDEAPKRTRRKKEEGEGDRPGSDE